MNEAAAISCEANTSARLLLPLLLAALLPGCMTVVDNFADRAVTYNRQAEEIKNHGLILNIIRAAYRSPLQFTDLTIVTGQSTLSGTLGLTVPLGGTVAIGTRQYSAAPSTTLSGGPNFNVAVLNTKEFYQGILSPIPMQTLTYYLREGIPPPLVLSLLLSEVTYGGIRIENTPATYQQFRDVLEALLRDGLDAEEVDSPVVWGPPFSHLVDLRDIAQLEAKGFKIVKVDDKCLPESEGRCLYQLQKPKADFRFCFHKPNKDAAQLQLTNLNVILRATKPTKSENLYLKQATEEKNTLNTLSNGFVPSVKGKFCGIHDDASKLSVGNSFTHKLETVSTDGKESIDVTVGTRSVEEIIYYLGEIVRYELGLDKLADGAEFKTPQVSVGRTKNDTLFSLSSTRPEANQKNVRVDYADQGYYLVVDPTGHDRSSQVLELVAQLLIENNSAKDLPAPSIIPVISH